MGHLSSGKGRVQTHVDLEKGGEQSANVGEFLWGVEAGPGFRLPFSM